MKSQFLIFASLVVALLYVGCDGEYSDSEQENFLEDFDVETKSSQLSEEDSQNLESSFVSDSKQEEGVAQQRRDERGPIYISWKDFDQEDAVKVKDLVATITNNSGHYITVTPTLTVSGLLTKEGAIEFDELDIQAGEAVEISVRANELPIRSTANINQVGVIASLIHTGLAEENGVEPTPVLKMSPSIYYVHNEDFDKVYIFGEKYLLEEYQGHLAGKTEEYDHEEDLMGYIADKSGVFQPIYKDDESFTDDSGIQLIGESSSMGIEEGRKLADTQRYDAPFPDALRKFCANYNVLYEDSGFGEDVLKETVVTPHPAGYARYGIYKKVNGGWYLAKTGILLSNGCMSEYAFLETNHDYKFVVSSEFVRSSGRKVWVLSEGATSWSTSNVQRFIKYFSLPIGAPNASTTVNFGGNARGGASLSWAINMSGIATRTVRYANTIGMISNQNIILRNMGETKFGGSSGNYYYVHTSNVSSNLKFKAVHEVGHAIGAAGNYNLRGGFYGMNSLYSLCNCDDVTGAMDFDHCLQKKMEIRPAQSEGWAHFISSVIFNYRDQSNGTFVYYKDVKVGSNKNPIVINHPYAVTLTSGGSDVNQRQAETYCTSSDNDWRYAHLYGTEWDWLHFFWNVWNKGMYKLSVSEIREIWPRDSDENDKEDYQWGEQSGAYTIYERADDKLSDAELDNFEDKAIAAGVTTGW